MGSAMPAWVQTALAVASWGLVVGAWVLIAVWARGKRGAGARWCAKCLYDMTGLPGLRCPECGRDAKSERQLRRRKRRGWALVAAAVLFVLNYAMWVPVRLRHEGWKTALVPTGALVLGLPWVAQDRIDRSSANPSGGPSAVKMPVWDAAFHLLFDRIARDELSTWHWEAVGQIGVRSDVRELFREWRMGPSMVHVLETGFARGKFRDSMVRRIENLAWIDVRTREVWPRGSTVIAHIRVRRWQPHRDKGVRVRIVDSHGEEAQLEKPGRQTHQALMAHWVAFPTDLIQTWRIVPEGSPAGRVQRYRVQLVREDEEGNAGAPFATKAFDVTIAPERVEEFLTPVRLAANDVIQGISEIRSDRANGGFHLELMPRTDRLDGMNMMVAISVDVYRGHDKRFTGTAWFPSDGTARRGGRDRVQVDLEAVGLRKLSGEGPWRVVISSHPELALADFECDRYWQGQGEWVVPVGEDAKTE